MLLFAVLGSAAFTFVNAFGAWVTQYRRRWIAGLFLAAAFVLAVAVVALLYRTRIALWPLGLGLLLTVTGSLFHARFVTAHVGWPNHLLRLLSAGLAVAAAWCVRA